MTARQTVMNTSILDDPMSPGIQVRGSWGDLSGVSISTEDIPFGRVVTINEGKINNVLGLSFTIYIGHVGVLVKRARYHSAGSVDGISEKEDGTVRVSGAIVTSCITAMVTTDAVYVESAIAADIGKIKNGGAATELIPGAIVEKSGLAGEVCTIFYGKIK